MKLSPPQERLPDEYRRAIRLALGVGIPCLLGYGVILPEHLALSPQLSSACKWAAITCVVVGAPVIGKVNQVGGERMLGTVVGGSLGFLFYAVGSHLWNESTDGVFLSLGATLVAGSSAVLGVRLNLDMSARLYVITFLLVCFGSHKDTDALLVAACRVAGIAAGVLLALLLSIVVAPRSASVAAVRNLEDALSSLRKLTTLAWQEHLPPPPGGRVPARRAPRRDDSAASGGQLCEPLLGYDPEAPPSPPARGGSAIAAAAAAAAAAASGASAPPGGPAPAGAALAPPPWRAREEQEAFEEECEKQLTAIYQALFKLSENAELAKGEVLVTMWRGHLLYMPGLPLCGRAGASGLPWQQMGELATSIRRVARLLYQVVQSLEGGLVQQLQALLQEHYPQALMPQLAAACALAVGEVGAAFPCGAGPADVGAAGLRELGGTVAAMLDATDKQRQRVVRALQHRRGGPSARRWGGGGGGGALARWPSPARVLRLAAAPGSPPRAGEAAEARGEGAAGQAARPEAAAGSPRSPFEAAADAGTAGGAGGGPGSASASASEAPPPGSPHSPPRRAGSEGGSSAGGAAQRQPPEAQGGGAARHGAGSPAPSAAGSGSGYLDSLASTLRTLGGSIGLPSLPARWRSVSASDLRGSQEREGEEEGRDEERGGGGGSEGAAAAAAAAADAPARSASAPAPGPAAGGGGGGGALYQRVPRVPSSDALYQRMSSDALYQRVPSSEALLFSMSLPEPGSEGGAPAAGAEAAPAAAEDGRLAKEASLGSWLAELQRSASLGSGALVLARSGGAEGGAGSAGATPRGAVSPAAGGGGAAAAPSAAERHPSRQGSPFHRAAAAAAAATPRGVGLASVITPLPPRPPLPPIATRRGGARVPQQGRQAPRPQGEEGAPPVTGGPEAQSTPPPSEDSRGMLAPHPISPSPWDGGGGGGALPALPPGAGGPLPYAPSPRGGESQPGSRALSLADRGFSFASGGSLLLFPDDAQGRLAEIHWVSFQAVMEDLVEELEELHEAAGEVLARLPA